MEDKVPKRKTGILLALPQLPVCTIIAMYIRRYAIIAMLDYPAVAITAASSCTTTIDGNTAINLPTCIQVKL